MCCCCVFHGTGFVEVSVEVKCCVDVITYRETLTLHLYKPQRRHVVKLE